MSNVINPTFRFYSLHPAASAVCSGMAMFFLLVLSHAVSAPALISLLFALPVYELGRWLKDRPAYIKGTLQNAFPFILVQQPAYGPHELRQAGTAGIPGLRYTVDVIRSKEGQFALTAPVDGQNFLALDVFSCRKAGCQTRRVSGKDLALLLPAIPKSVILDEENHTLNLAIIPVETHVEAGRPFSMEDIPQRQMMRVPVYYPYVR